MKSVLMIAYDFPPEGHAGVYRPLRFVRNLPSYGWKSTVIAAGGTLLQRPDPGLLAQLPDDTEVIRPIQPDDVWQSIQRRRARQLQPVAPPGTEVGAQQASVRSGRVRAAARELVRRLEACWYHPDMQARWIRPAVDAGIKVCGGARPEVIWATGPPWSSFVVAQQVARHTGIPYILDFRTSWTIVPSPTEAIRPFWAQRRDRRLLRELFAGAHAVTFFYEAEAECFWRRYRGCLTASRIHIIPNGFDGAVDDCALPGGETFRVLYTGTLSDYRYETFLEALSMLRQRQPEYARHVSVSFVGEGGAEVALLAKQLNVSDMVSTAAPVSYAEVNRLQRRAHALLMFERRPSMKGFELLAGAKLFGYLRAGRPILGVVPEGEAARVLRDVGVSTIGDPDSPVLICAALESMLKHWSTGTLSALVPTASACERYSGRAQTAALARALEGLPPVKLFTPGAVDIVPSLRAELARDAHSVT